MNALLLDLFTALVEKDPKRPLYTFVDVNGRDTERLTFGDVRTKAASIAGYLRARADLRAGDRAVLVYPPGLDFIPALVGCLMAGVVPVPVYPPNPFKLHHDLTGFSRLVADCNARAILTNTEFNRARRVGSVKDMMLRTRAAWPDLPWHATDKVGFWSPPSMHRPAPDDVAFLQYTSGSTSTPKGVRITHANIIGEIEDNARSIGVGPGTIGVSWVPQYHDLGLICCLMSVLAGNGHLYVLSPLSFIQRPAVWFETMDRVRATHTCSPNFGLALSVRKTTAQERAGWDLGVLEVILCGAEPIREDTVDEFYGAFEASKLRRSTFVPAYGIAEHTVSVACAPRPRPTRFDREALARGKVLPASDGSHLALFSNGPVAKAGSRVRIVDPETCQPVDDDTVGEIWVDSPTKAAGYFAKPEESRATFEARVAGDDADSRTYLRTGDLGFFYGGELYIAGRLKDVLIVRGRNYYPHDIEATAQAAHPQVRPGSAVAFGLTDAGGEGGVGIVVDVRDREASSALAREVAVAVRAAVERDHGLSCFLVAAGPPGTVLKTTSGKLRRRATREAALAPSPKAFLHLERNTNLEATGW